ncbi:MAG: acetyltransferase, partial [Methanoregula sp.]|nr:acetyltransferase [Methanoregula sp.]
TPAFFPAFYGKTWEGSPTSGWRQTYAGDGIVPHSDSILPGATLDILPHDPSVLAHSSDEYCHIKLPRNQEVIDRIIGYLKNN